MKIKVYLTGITAIAAAGLVLALSLFALPELAVAQDMQPLSITMEGYDYPYPVTYLPLTIEGQDLRMAYMDVGPEGSGNGRTVVLLHGKNFFGAYWRDTINALAHDGYRVIVPDQIGFGKSSKPNIHYSFHLLAVTTKKVLEAAGVSKVAVVGHSMGGMLATRFALMYPQMVTHLVRPTLGGIRRQSAGVGKTNGALGQELARDGDLRGNGGRHISLRPSVQQA